MHAAVTPPRRLSMRRYNFLSTRPHTMRTTCQLSFRFCPPRPAPPVSPAPASHLVSPHLAASCSAPAAPRPAILRLTSPCNLDYTLFPVPRLTPKYKLKLKTRTLAEATPKPSRSLPAYTGRDTRLSFHAASHPNKRNLSCHRPRLSSLLSKSNCQSGNVAYLCGITHRRYTDGKKQRIN